MAEKNPAHGNSANGKALMLSASSSSSNEPSPSGSSALEPYSRSRMSPTSNQASILVPVRLDVLLFLLNSAARGAQHALPTESVQGGQGTPYPCQHAPVAQHSPHCCGCSPACHSANQPGGIHHYGGDYGRGLGVPENRHNRDGSSHRREGTSWPSASSGGGWKIPQSSMGWQEKPQREGRGHGNRDNWQGRQQSFGRPRGDWRSGNSATWRSGSQEWRKEGTSSGSNCTTNKRSQEGYLQPSWDAPDAKRSMGNTQRPMDNAQMGWPKGQGTKEPTGFPNKPAGDGPGKLSVQENEEDWETDYEKEPTSSATPGIASCSSISDAPPDLSKEEDHASTPAPPKPSVVTSPLPELAFKPQAVVATSGKPPGASCVEQSKNGGFVTYLKSLYSDVLKKSSSDSSDLVIDTDVESSKLDEEEQGQSSENEAGGEQKSWE